MLGSWFLGLETIENQTYYFYTFYIYIFPANTRRCFNVVTTSCACWVYFELYHYSSLLWQINYIFNIYYYIFSCSLYLHNYCKIFDLAEIICVISALFFSFILYHLLFIFYTYFYISLLLFYISLLCSYISSSHLFHKYLTWLMDCSLYLFTNCLPVQREFQRDSSVEI